MQDAIADDAAEIVADDTGEEHCRCEERRLPQLVVVLVQEVRRQPRQIQPQRPAVAEVHDRHRQHPAREPPPGHPWARGGRGEAAIRQALELVTCDAGMVGRQIPVVPDPHDHPHETAAAEHDEGAAPRHERDQPRDDGWRDEVAETCEGVREALREAAAIGRRPALHRSRRDRKRCAFADPEHHPHQKEHHQAAGGAGENCGGGPDHAADEEGQARAETIADPAAEHLEEQVRIAERGEDQPEPRVRQRQLTSDLRRGGCDVHAIDVRDQVHHAQQPEDDGRRWRAFEFHHRSGSSSPWCNSICIRAALHPSSTPTRLPRWGPGRGGVAPPSHTTGMLGRRALPAGRIAALGATMDLHHGLLDYLMNIDKWPIPVSLSPSRTQLDPRNNSELGRRNLEFVPAFQLHNSKFQISTPHMSGDPFRFTRSTIAAAARGAWRGCR